MIFEDLFERLNIEPEVLENLDARLINLYGKLSKMDRVNEADLIFDTIPTFSDMSKLIKKRTIEALRQSSACQFFFRSGAYLWIWRPWTLVILYYALN